MSEPESVLDAAYFLSKRAHGAVAHGRAKEVLSRRFPQLGWDEIVDAYLRGSALADGCFEVGDRARKEGIQDADALRLLKERFPGFSEATYQDALTWGWFSSR
jgi:hypothetical protein